MSYVTYLVIGGGEPVVKQGRRAFEPWPARMTPGEEEAETNLGDDFEEGAKSTSKNITYSYTNLLVPLFAYCNSYFECSIAWPSLVSPPQSEC